eukprot:TRINITY_DN93_c0_g1_i1.p3 TRINITY_DN93_c0_g1~~TRINITY_DN93_c0_g1_i1.p3  ORF type:complete len:92 (+),score=15.05 TRINITY_DN93_c0_g1_i1:552-827(+)
MKKSTRGITWKKRFVVLTDTNLIYYDQYGDRFPKADIDLATLTRIEKLNHDRILLYMGDARIDFRANDPLMCSEWIKQSGNFPLPTRKSKI